MLFRTFPLARPLLAISAAALAACSQQTPTHSGFLSDYSTLEVPAGTKAVEEYWRPNTRWETYRTATIAPVSVVLNDEAKAKAGQDNLVALQAHATASLRAAAGTRFTLARETDGEGVRIHAAITGVDLSGPALNTLSTVVLLATVDTGGASAEIEIRDAATGVVLHRRTAAVNGKPFWLSRGLKKTGHAQRALDIIFSDMIEAIPDRGNSAGRE